MKKVKKISLVNLSKDEMNKRELSKLLGGYYEVCCICGYGRANMNANNAADLSSPGGGYGTGSFRGELH